MVWFLSLAQVCGLLRAVCMWAPVTLSTHRAWPLWPSGHPGSEDGSWRASPLAPKHKIIDPVIKEMYWKCLFSCENKPQCEVRPCPGSWPKLLAALWVSIVGCVESYPGARGGHCILTKLLVQVPFDPNNLCGDGLPWDVLQMFVANEQCTRLFKAYVIGVGVWSAFGG